MTTNISSHNNRIHIEITMPGYGSSTGYHPDITGLGCYIKGTGSDIKEFGWNFIYDLAV